MNIDLSAAVHTVNSMIRGLIALLPNLIVAGLLMTVVWFIAGVIGRTVEKMFDRTQRHSSVSIVLGRLARWVVMGAGLMLAMTIVVPSMNASSLLGALGVSGLAIGFAFKDIFQNLLAGLLLLITRPFQIGDVIVSGPHEGTVEDIQVRATLMRTYDNRVVVIPNSDLYTNRVIVITAKPERRGQIVVGIGYGEDVERAKQIILDAITPLAQIEKQPAPTVTATELADFSVNLAVRYWVGPSTQRNMVAATDAVIIAVKKALDGAGVEIAFPTQTLHICNDEGKAAANDEDRAAAQPAIVQAAR